MEREIKPMLIRRNYLKFYEDEHKLFADAYNIKIGVIETQILFKKISRHFKIKTNLRFGGRGGNGKCFNWFIRLPHKDNSVGLLCHELAHAYEKQKYGKSKHTKRLMRILLRIANYCRKQDFWQDEINRRLEPKPIKIITKEQIQNTKIEKAKEKIKRYESKVKMYSKKLEV